MKKLIGILIITGVLLTSCNLPMPGTITDSAISTVAAQTVQAALNTSPLASPTAGPSTPVTITPTFSNPMIAVGEVTNCRSGPGVNFEQIVQISPGQQVKVIGVLVPDYWVVSTSAGVCWVKTEFATPMGSMQVVPTVTAPATPTGNAPEGVSLQKWDIFCNYQTNQADVTIKWADKGNDETGYRVIRNGGVVAELPANTTQYKETISLLSGQSVGYSVEVFNAIGTSSSKTIALSC